MRRVSLAGQLGMAFAAVAAFTALLATAFVAVSWQRTFEDYVREGVQRQATGLAAYASDLYVPNGGWSSQSLARLAAISENSGLRLQLLDTDGKVLIDSAAYIQQTHPFDIGQLTPGGAEPATVSPSPMREPVVQVPVYTSSGQVRVGSIRLASNSPGTFLDERDERFRQASSTGLALAAGLAVVLASAAGLLFSRRYSTPIERVTRTAAALRAGRLDARSGLTGDDAVGILSRTLDEMADSIQAEREFERRLTADVAHELRTPLQAIQATVEAMQDGVLPADGERLGTVRNETVRLARLAESILELSRLENRSVSFRMSEIDPAVPLQRAVETHRALFDSLDLELETSIEEGAATIDGDTDRLTQAFGNLVSNAARYTPEGGRVAVGLRVELKRVVITVRDTGIGIAPEDRDRVFTRFWRSDQARERGRGGFGIGLAVVREIVEQHGGSVSFHSNEPEPGTTFVVELPALRKRQRV